MAVFQNVRIFKQKGIPKCQVDKVIWSVRRFYEICGIKKITIVVESKECLLHIFEVNNERSEWNGFLNGMKLIKDFSNYMNIHFNSSVGILIVDDPLFSEANNQRFEINGICSPINRTAVVRSFDILDIDNYRKFASVVIHELGHIFCALPDTRIFNTTLTFDVYKHCTREDCAMHETELFSINKLKSDAFCETCLYYIKWFVHTQIIKLKT